MEVNPVGWFEIPTKDLDRAIAFYESVFAIKLQKHPVGPLMMAFFPMEQDKAGCAGALVYNEENYTPSREGTLIYFASENLATELERVEKAGGEVLREKTLIAKDIGYMGLFIDSEGNRIALHSRH